MGTQRVQMKVVLPWLVRTACRAGTRAFISALTAVVGPMHNIFFLALYYFNSFVPPPSKLGRQSCRVACLLVCVSGIEPDFYVTVLFNVIFRVELQGSLLRFSIILFSVYCTHK
jgi:hypothetical protein